MKKTAPWRRFKAFRFHSLSFVLTLVIAAYSAVPARAEDELIVADQKGQQKALMQAAGVDRDLSYHIRWVEFEAAAPLLQALGAGAVDTGIAGDGPFIFAWGAGLPIRAAWLIPPRGGGKATAVVAPEGSPITSAAQLSGKRIATGRGSIGHLLLLRLLATGAIPAPAPKIVFLLPAQAKAALDTGRVDAWSTWEPYVSLAVVAGHGHVVTDAADLMPNNSFFVASTDALANKRAHLTDFYRRMTAAYGWGARHQAEYAHILARQTGIPDDVAVSVAEKLIATPAPVTSDTVRSEASVVATYRSAGFVVRSDAFDEAFEKNLTSP
ncbi:ABC transporter substrate-binding protein [Acetobacter sp.]|uniref:ABC transporter substrate-binding protein n=1 Tax=Acetobacter sp. TaxID=440 RepID=UPI0025C21375|nr:ABC transporter substrate-binding protein [Acetobacter sp.]MCH4092667.1 ABC transporter substrate-binding protein [Acetobacter sp.]MCI1301231.1 ABC transporter substrate-binding protein [Acetobacter sp.]MCI1317492.1 ABC transporter substrate-binding protein [Acetobacter sp.]